MRAALLLPVLLAVPLAHGQCAGKSPGDECSDGDPFTVRDVCTAGLQCLGASKCEDVACGDGHALLSDYAAARAACDQACSDQGHCCTKSAGGTCDRLPCTAGCHIAWFSKTADDCEARCAAADARTHGCEGYDWKLSTVEGTSFDSCTGTPKHPLAPNPRVRGLPARVNDAAALVHVCAGLGN